jgi:hypothetical protein
MAIDDEVFVMRHSLKPFDYKNSTVADVHLRGRYLDRLLAAKDDKERESLMQKPAYRQAAFEGDHTLSGLGEQTYNRLYEAELRSKFGEQMTTADDHAVADDILGHVLNAASSALANEFKAIGEPVDEPHAPLPSTPWE